MHSLIQSQWCWRGYLTKTGPIRGQSWLAGNAEVMHSFFPDKKEEVGRPGRLGTSLSTTLGVLFRKKWHYKRQKREKLEIGVWWEYWMTGLDLTYLCSIIFFLISISLSYVLLNCNQMHFNWYYIISTRRQCDCRIGVRTGGQLWIYHKCVINWVCLPHPCTDIPRFYSQR